MLHLYLLEYIQRVSQDLPRVLYQHVLIGGTHNNLKLYKDNAIEFCQEYKYLGVIFDTSGTDDKEIRSRVMQTRKCIACLNGVLWSKDIRKERKLNIYNALIKSSLLYGAETWRLTENNKRRVEATEMYALRRSSRISRKDRIRNVTIRQQIGLEETIIMNRTSSHGTAVFKEWQKEDCPKSGCQNKRRARGRPK
jgi:hypothetical protein